MGIYYSSVGTRLERRLADEGLTIEDFAVLNPKLCFYIRQLGKKSVSAIYDSLEEKGMKPGEWDGVPNAMFYRAISYYKEHKEEIRKEHPIVYINKKDSKQVDSVDWSSFRRRQRIYLQVSVHLALQSIKTLLSHLSLSLLTNSLNNSNKNSHARKNRNQTAEEESVSRRCSHQRRVHGGAGSGTERNRKAYGNGASLLPARGKAEV